MQKENVTSNRTTTHVWFLVFLESFLYYIIMRFNCTCIVSGQSALMLLINVCACVYV